MSAYDKQCSAFSNSTLKSLRHVESVHEGKKSFKCNVRDTPFSEKCNLNGHIESVHDSKHIGRNPIVDCEQKRK